MPDLKATRQSLLEAEEARGVDLVVIDTRPGTHTDTEDFCLISDLVLIPARPVYAEWEMTHRAVLWMDDLRASIAEGERFPAVRVLVMDAGPKIIDAATREGEWLNCQSATRTCCKRSCVSTIST